MRIQASILSVCLLLCFCWLMGENFWDKKHYSEWTEKEASKVLSDSPWADEKVLGDTFVTAGPPSAGMSGGGGRRGSGASGGDTEEDLAQARSVSIRLHSAMPIRMALARRAQLSGAFDDQQSEEFVQNQPAPGYIILGLAMRGGRGRMSFEDEEVEALKKKVYVELEHSKRRIPFERLVPPGLGGPPEAYLYFPRIEDGKDLFVPEEEGFKFVANLDSRTKVQINFKFSKMMFGGRLEI